MLIKTLLNRIEHFKSFVYGSVTFQDINGSEALVVAIKARAYAALTPKTPLAPYTIEQRDSGPHDVLIDILICGVCHSDIHQIRNEWGGSIFPMVPGHEIIGTVVNVGDKVKKWHAGDTVGVGCFVDSCRACEACRAGEEWPV